jgi:methionine-rich copper-binding protein CopC
VASAPSYLHLFFDAAPDVSRSSIMLQTADGARAIPLTGLHTMDSGDLMISIAEPLAAGAYSVTWSSASGNGGAQQMGSYRFEVESAAP